MQSNWILLLSIAAALLMSPAIGAAEVVNGDFEEGETGWTLLPIPNWRVDILPVDGNPGGCARILSSDLNSGGTGCVTVAQAFECGSDPGFTCEITVDYEHFRGLANPLAARVKIFLDGNLVHTSPPTDKQPWTTVTLSADCGEHVINLCLEVDEGDNGWIALFDNVTARCDSPTPSEEGTWGSIKSLYQ